MSENIVSLAKPFALRRPSTKNRVQKEKSSDSTSSYSTSADTGAYKYFTTSDLDKLQELVLEKLLSDRIQILIGNQGTGKSRFLDNLLSSLSSRFDVRHISPEHVLGEEKLIALLSEAVLSKSFSTIRELKQGLKSAFHNNENIVVSIEDAHNLSPFAINLLIEIKRYADDLSLPLFFVLFARPEIKRSLESVSLVEIEQYVDSYQMPYFSFEQTVSYIKKRVIASGYEFDAVSENIWKSIHQKAGGVPAAINHFVDLHMTQNINSNRLQIWFNDNRSMVVGWLGKMAIITSLLFIAFIFYDATRSSNMRYLKNDTASLKLPALDMFVKQDVPFAKEEVAKIISAKVSEVEASKAIAVNMKPEKNVNNSVATNENVASSLPVFDDLVSKMIAISDGNTWLMNQLEGSYTIQLAASSNKKNINAYINKHALTKQFTDIQLERNKSDWYVVVIGAFDTVSQARAFVALMPSTLKNNNPWIRKISSLKGKLKSNLVSTRNNSLKQAASLTEKNQSLNKQFEKAPLTASGNVTVQPTVKEGELELFVPPL